MTVAFISLLTTACGSSNGTASGSTSSTSSASVTSAAPGSTSAGTSTSSPPPPASTSTPPTTQPAETLPPPETVVALDPGHNGANGAHPEIINQQVDAGGFQKACNTTGASTDQGISESQINWEITQLLRDRLEDAGVAVLLTRDSDDGVGPCIDERGRMAAEAEADLLVSLHADGAAPELGGFHVIHPGLRPGYTDTTVEPSTDLATRLRDSLTDAGFTPASYAGTGGLHQRDDMGTLNHAGVPAAIVEAGNLRHPPDAALLTGEAGQAQLVEALATGILGYLG